MTEKQSGPRRVALFSKLVGIADKPLSVALWYGLRPSQDASESSKDSVSYYAKYRGAAVRTASMKAAVAHGTRHKLCVLFPGFNGGPFDLFHIAEALAARGYWVISVACRIDPKVKADGAGGLIEAALEQAYLDYDQVLYLFEQLSGIKLDADSVEHILYISFSAGIYPLLKALKQNRCRPLPHRFMFIAPALSKAVGSVVFPFPVADISIIHSRLDKYPTYGDPLKYLGAFREVDLNLYLLDRGRHHDFVYLPPVAVPNVERSDDATDRLLKAKCARFVIQTTCGAST